MVLKYIIGIDFGTTTTAISCTRIGATFEPELVEIENQRTTESVLRLTPDGEIELIGLKAWENIAEAPNRTFYEFKLHVASKDQIPFEREFLTAKKIGMLFLQNLRQKMERGLFGNTSLKEIDAREGMFTVIGHPSGWNEAQKKATIAMAEEAGFPNVTGCEEPIGALYYHYYLGDLSLDKEQNVLIYDFGGGTSDVAIIKTSGSNHPKAVATSGVSNLGGRNFDENIAALWEKKLLGETGKTELSKRDRAWIRRHSRKIKEELSMAVEGQASSASETIPNLQCKGGRDTLVLDVPSFEEMNKDLLSKFKEPVWDALSSASLNPADINIVILTGGSGRFYFARSYLKDIFQDVLILRSANPQEAVSKGLALFSKALACGKENVQKKVVGPEPEASGKVARKNLSSNAPKREDPYAVAAEKDKKNLSRKMLLLGGIGFFTILLLFFLLNGGEKGKPKVTTNAMVNSAQLSEKERNEAALSVIFQFYQRLKKAQDEQNIALIKSIQAEINAIDLNGTIVEVQDVKSSLSAWAHAALEYYDRYGKHPEAQSYKILSKSKKVDQFNTEKLQDLASVDAWEFHNAFWYFWYCRGKACLALGEKDIESVVKYSVRIREFRINKDLVDKYTNYSPFSEIGELDPDIKILVAWTYNSNFTPIKVYPRDRESYVDTLSRKVNERFVWYASPKDSLAIFIIDVDASNGELLDYKMLPRVDFSGWFNVGSGCEVFLDMDVESLENDK